MKDEKGRVKELINDSLNHLSFISDFPSVLSFTP